MPRTLCCSPSAMSCDSATVMAAGSTISISTLYRDPKWYARVMSTCTAGWCAAAMRSTAWRDLQVGGLVL